MNLRKICGVLLLVAGPVCIVTGVAKISGAFNDAFGNRPMSGFGGGPVWVFAGFFLLAGGMFLTSANIAGSLMQKMRGLRWPGKPGAAAEIERLAKLRADGYITGDDYEAAKKKLLDDL